MGELPRTWFVVGMSFVLATGCGRKRTPPRAIDAAVDARPAPPVDAAIDADLSHVYPTNGAHHAPIAGEGCLSPACDPAQACACPRQPGAPPDPQWPAAWTSRWTMYRVFGGWQQHPPPYDDRDGKLVGVPLVAGKDYEVSEGSSYYDADYHAPGARLTGAMMEYYPTRCLPIFPGDNHYACAFVSLGETAYFLRFADPAPVEPAPETATSICLFSPDNHPPPRDFVGHLPWNPDDARRLGDRVLAYSLTVGEPPILFGYAFERTARADGGGAPYQHPHSFYFSGYYDPSNPGAPPDAPIVSQNYHGFAATPPPASLWQAVQARRAREPASLPYCNLFPGEGGAARAGHGWHALRR